MPGEQQWLPPRSRHRNGSSISAGAARAKASRADEEAFVMSRAEARFGAKLAESASAPRLDEIKLHAPRVSAPASLPFCTSDHYDRAAHTYGKSYPELARGLARDYANAPDVVAYPRNEQRGRRRARLGRRRGCDRHAVRRRIERVRRRRADRATITRAP